MSGKLFLCLLSLFLTLTGCDFQTNEETSKAPLEQNSVQVQENKADSDKDVYYLAKSWYRSGLTVSDVIELLDGGAYTPEEATQSLDAVFSISTKVKNTYPYDMGSLTEAQSESILNNKLLPLRFDGHTQLFEDYKKLEDEMGPHLNPFGRRFMFVGSLVQEMFETDFDPDHYLRTLDELLKLQKEARDTTLNERVKQLQGTFLISSIGNRESHVYAEGNKVDGLFQEKFESYVVESEGETYHDFVLWLRDRFEDNHYAYSSENQADMRMLSVFGSDFDQYKVSRTSQVLDNEIKVYYTFENAPHESSALLNGLNERVESEVKRQMGFNKDVDKSFYMSQSVGLATDKLLSVIYHCEVLTKNNEKVIEKISYLIDLEEKAFLSLDDVFSNEYARFSEKLNDAFMSRYSGKLLDGQSVNITSEVPFYLSGDYVYFDLPERILNENFKYETRFIVNLYDYIEHVDLERIGLQK